MDDMISYMRSVIQCSRAVKKGILTDPDLLTSLTEITEEIILAFNNGNKVFFCGNGGSAADAQHLSSELSGKYYLDRKALNSEALHVNTSYLTAVANDYSFDEVFSRLVSAKCDEGDILVGISTSGNSENVIRAIRTANEMGVITVGFTGKSGGKLRGICNYLINVPSDDTPRIQESHIMLGHVMCEIVEKELFGDSNQK